VPFAAERTFFYAPAVQYYVRREDRFPGESTQVIQLTDFHSAVPTLPIDANTMRLRALQSALETTVSGQRQDWQTPDRIVTGSVEPLRTFRNNAGRFCRIYSEQISTANRLYRFNGQACRLADARWHQVRS
jgi:surface antigen